MLLCCLLLTGLCKVVVIPFLRLFQGVYSIFRDRIRTTNNLLGDCYTAAIVEYLSRHELKTLSTSSSYNTQESTPMIPKHSESDDKVSYANSVTVDIGGGHLSKV
jgi:hypothetical protein